MNELSSTEFRKTFARLEVPTIVTVNGHPIGTWSPIGGVAGIIREEHVGPNGERIIDRMDVESVSVSPRIPKLRGSTQAQRDDLLRKINRGK